MHKFSVCAYNSQDFAQTPENFARSHDRVTVTFRNSAGGGGLNGGLTMVLTPKCDIFFKTLAKGFHIVLSMAKLG